MSTLSGGGQAFDAPDPMSPAGVSQVLAGSSRYAVTTCAHCKISAEGSEDGRLKAARVEQCGTVGGRARRRTGRCTRPRANACKPHEGDVDLFAGPVSLPEAAEV